LTPVHNKSNRARAAHRMLIKLTPVHLFKFSYQNDILGSRQPEKKMLPPSPLNLQDDRPNQSRDLYRLLRTMRSGVNFTNVLRTVFMLVDH